MDDLFGEEDDEAVVATGRAASCGVLAFHSGTEAAMLLHVRRTTQPGVGNIPSVLAAIDEYCTTRHWMMHVGPTKASILLREVGALLQQRPPDAPLLFVEIGSYCGYSCVTLLHHFLQRFPGVRMVCVEGDPECVKWTRELVAYCGLEAHVTVLEAVVTQELAKEVLPRFGDKIDVLFIDHDKARYTSDLILLEDAPGSLLQSGSIVVADNVLSFGKPLSDYLAHVRDQERYASSALFEDYVEYADESPQFRDALEISVRR